MEALKKIATDRLKSLLFESLEIRKLREGSMSADEMD